MAWRIAKVISIFILVLNSLSIPALAQLPSPEPERVVNIYSADNSTDLAVGNVHLDGRQIFALTAPALSTEQQEAISISPIRQRVQTVRSQLQKSAKTQFDAETLKVNYRLDPKTQLPIISINGDYLMTVTIADARLYGVEPATHAQNLTQIIKDALLRSQWEHQPEFLAQQGLRAGGIFLSVFLLSLVTCLRQRYIKARHRAVLTQLERLNASKEELEKFSKPDLDEATAAQQQIARKQRLKFWYEVRQRLLQLGQIGIWGSGISLCLSLFPQTRWIQSLLLRGLSVTLLKLILIGAIALLTRLKS